MQLMIAATFMDTLILNFKYLMMHAKMYVLYVHTLQASYWMVCTYVRFDQVAEMDSLWCLINMSGTFQVIILLYLRFVL